MDAAQCRTQDGPGRQVEPGRKENTQAPLGDQRRLSRQRVTHPYQRWLGAPPSSRYTILMRLR